MTDQQSSIPLSVCVITLNEEDHIRTCLESVSWADDLLVVDSGSEDRTVELAEEVGARVIHNEFPGHVEQKQYATDRAEHDWVLSLDADEEVSKELQESIRSLFAAGTPDPDTTYALKRLSRYLGTWQYHGSWYPDWVVRLFNRKQTHWGGENPHDRVLPAEETVRLDGHLLHYPYDNLSDHLDYIDSYTDIMAREKDENGERGSILKAVSHGGFKFFRDYVLKGGFLDGATGAVNAVMGSYYVFLKYVKLWERQTIDES